MPPSSAASASPSADGDAGAARRELARNFCADAGGAAGDQGDFCHFLFPLTKKIISA